MHPDTVLEQHIRQFHAEYAADLQALMAALDEARISHYSSGCGTKSVTFDIFPASAYVAALLNMISLDRAHKPKPQSGLRDAAVAGNYSPAQDFLLYLCRWLYFAEQAMQNEGDTARGVAAGRAKLLMTDLLARLKRSTRVAQVKPKAGRIMERKPANDAESDFARLMRAIGLTLEARKRTDTERQKTDDSRTKEHNYTKALAAAQETLPKETPADEVQAA